MVLVMMLKSIIFIKGVLYRTSLVLVHLVGHIFMAIFE